MTQRRLVECLGIRGNHNNCFARPTASPSSWLMWPLLLVGHSVHAWVGQSSHPPTILYPRRYFSGTAFYRHQTDGPLISKVDRPARNLLLRAANQERQTRPGTSGRARNSSSSSTAGRRSRPRRSGGNGGRRRDQYLSKSNKKQNSNNPADAMLESDPLPKPQSWKLTSSKDKTSNRRRPFFFTCRHTYEEDLMDELRYLLPDSTHNMEMSSPFPGLVQVSDTLAPASASNDDSSPSSDHLLPLHLDPVYALQSLPSCVVVSADSIKGLSREIHHALLGNDDDADNDNTDDYNNEDCMEEMRAKLRTLPRGSLAVHALVPGMFKGQPKPAQLRRVSHIADDLLKRLQRRYAAARSTAATDANTANFDERWLLQVLLVEPTVAVASLVPCQSLQDEGIASWPNWYLPAGLANVEVVEDDRQPQIPSSAFRKLLEAFHCMRRSPFTSGEGGVVNSKVVDLGASPGGWTAALLGLVTTKTSSKDYPLVWAVDRATLAPHLMNDPRISFVKGDAFTYRPPWCRDEHALLETHNSIPKDTWMVSDIVAYPDRVLALLDDWCGHQWADSLVVTMKFQGSEIPWSDLERARQTALKHGYSRFRAKHLFNNKNEVTLMIEQPREIANDSEMTASPTVPWIDSALYPAHWPPAAS